MDSSSGWRCNAQLDAWLDAVDDTRWIDCPGGINTRERTDLPAHLVPRKFPPEIPTCGAIVIDSDERRGYEQAKREQAMERARQRLEELKERIAAGDLSGPRKIGAAVERIMKISRPSIFRLERTAGRSSPRATYG